MPIAYLTLSDKSKTVSEKLVEEWAGYADVSAGLMTVNIVHSDIQLGKAYEVMAVLHLPAVWSRAKVSRIQQGLSQSLASHLDLDEKEIHIVTHIVESGLVVENGAEVHW